MDDTQTQLKHKQLDTLLTMITANIPVLVTGEAGNGKSHSVEQASRLLGTGFHSLSVGEQTTISAIMGYIDAMGKPVLTGFFKAFTEGGIYLLDEIDAGNPNVLLAINTAIANGFAYFPHGLFHAHKDFRLVATANTYGTGGGSKYVGRNKLDLATLNRFAILDWVLDKDLERHLVSNKDWLNVVYKAREISDDIDNVLISQRTATYGDKLLKAGLSLEDTFKSIITAPLDDYSTNQLNEAMSEYVVSEEVKFLQGLLDMSAEDAISKVLESEYIVEDLHDTTLTSSKFSGLEKATLAGILTKVDDIKSKAHKKVVFDEIRHNYNNLRENIESSVKLMGVITSLENLEIPLAEEDVEELTNIFTEYKSTKKVTDNLERLSNKPYGNVSTYNKDIKHTFTYILTSLSNEHHNKKIQEGSKVLITSGANIGSVGTVIGLASAEADTGTVTIYTVALKNKSIKALSKDIRIL